MNKRIKQISFSIAVIVALISLVSIPAAMDSLDESLIVSIIDANYPPHVGTREDWDFAIYGIDLVYQVENPTDEDVRIDSTCAPVPFPQLSTNLENESIVIYCVMVIENVPGVRYIPPGISNDTFHFEILAENYKEEILPIGEYSLWFNYTHCSIAPIPVILEKLVITVTDDNVTYFFEHDSREDIYTFETTYYWIGSVGVIFIGAIFYQQKKRRFV